MKEQIISLASKFSDIANSGQYGKELNAIGVDVDGIFDLHRVRMGDIEVTIHGKEKPSVKFYSGADLDPEYLNQFIEEYLNKFHQFVSEMPTIDISNELKEIEAQELALKARKEKLLQTV